MRRSRKLTAMILVLLLSLAFLASCGGSDDAAVTSDGASANTPANTPANNPAETPANTPGTPIEIAPPPEPVPVPEDAKFADSIELIINGGMNSIDILSPLSGGRPCSYIHLMIFDRLFQNDDDGNLVPMLAKEYNTTDYKTFEFKLRDDVSFHNGDKLTAQRVVDAVEMAKDSPGVEAYDTWRVVETARAVDEYTVEMTLAAVDVDFLPSLAISEASIFNAEAMKADPENGPSIGTGLYRVKDIVHGDYVTVEKNESYWGEPAITQTVTVRFVADVAVRAMMMLNGEAQWSLDTSPEDLERFRNNPDFYLYPLINNNVWYLSFNQTDPLMADRDFRMAVAYAIDKEEITLASVGADGGFAETEGTLWAWATPYRNHNIPMIQQDLNKAKEYLAASTYNGQDAEIVVAIDFLVRGSEVILYELGQVGINITINQMDGPSMMAYSNPVNNQTQMMYSTFSPTLLPSYYRGFVGTGGGNNRASYSNPTLDEMIAASPSITNPAEREAHFFKMQEMVADDAPYLGIFWKISEFVCAKGFGGAKFSEDMRHDFRYVYQVLED